MLARHHYIDRIVNSAKMRFPIIFFGAAILVSKVWFACHVKRTEAPMLLQLNLEIPNYNYKLDPLESRVARALGTSNLLNLHFLGQSSNRFSVFLAEWPPGQEHGGALFVHTPQICWVGAGFRRVHKGETTDWPIIIGGRKIPFQCCVLSHPNLKVPEIVLWAACIDGNWSDAVYVFPRDLIVGDEPVRDRIKKSANIIRTRITAFIGIIANPPPTKACKQFVRISMPLTTDWRSGLAELETFVHQILLPRIHLFHRPNN